MMVKKQESGIHLQFAVESELHFRIEVNRAAIIIIYTCHFNVHSVLTVWSKTTSSFSYTEANFSHFICMLIG